MEHPDGTSCPPDPFIEMWNTTYADIDPVDGDKDPYNHGCWDLECVPEMKIYWDQWLVCVIVCLHGYVRGTACGINFTEGMTKAIEQFNKVDHSKPCIVRLDDEPWGEYWTRCRATRAELKKE